MDYTLVIMAAGLGSRYGGLKQLDSFGNSGETLLEFSSYDAIKSGFNHIIFIIQPHMETVFKKQITSKLPKHIKITFIHQTLEDLPQNFIIPEDLKTNNESLPRTKPWGTGHAIWVARKAITTPFAVINADDYYGKNTFHVIVDFFKNNPNNQHLALVGYDLASTLSPNGTVSRGVCQINSNNFLEKIIEYTSVYKENDTIHGSTDKSDETITLSQNSMVSMNCWAFYPQFLNFLEGTLVNFLTQNYLDPKQEFHLPMAIDAYINSNEHNQVKVLTCDNEWFGVTYPEDKVLTRNKIQKKYEKQEYPKSLWT